MFKQEIKVMDCTVRDGGLMNKWQFSDDFVRGVYNACVEAGIDYMEIGYLSSEKHSVAKKWGRGNSVTKRTLNVSSAKTKQT